MYLKRNYNISVKSKMKCNLHREKDLGMTRRRKVVIRRIEL